MSRLAVIKITIIAVVTSVVSGIAGVGVTGLIVGVVSGLLVAVFVGGDTNVGVLFGVSQLGFMVQSAATQIGIKMNSKQTLAKIEAL